VWPFARKSSSTTTGGSGWIRGRGRARPSFSRCPRRKLRAQPETLKSHRGDAGAKRASGCAPREGKPRAMSQAISRILVVEDQPVPREVLAKILARNGYEVRAVASVEEALAIGGTFCPHVLL